MAFDHTHLPTTRRPGGGRARRALVACLTLAATTIPPAAASASDAPPPGETQPGSGQPGAVLVPGPKPPGHADTDFDGDGFADLAIGTPGDRVGGGARGGTVRVLYGAATGLGSVRIQVWSQNSAGVQDSSEEGDQFGASVETGDFDVDGFSDLAIGAPGESYVRGLQHDGVVHVIYGSAAGLSSAGNQVWSQDTPGVPFGAQSNDHFGRTLSAGDFDGDGADDLVIGTPDEDLGLGAVHVLPGSIAGLSSTGAQVWTQESPGIADAAESTDRFGMALATGDFDGDGSDDLAVGVDEAVDWVAIGAVHVIYGSAGGLSCDQI